MNNRPVQSRTIRVWDLPLRLFHWSLAICVSGAILSAKLSSEFADGMAWHKRFGIAVLTLLVFRLIWGFTGSTHARFSSFLPTPRKVLTYLKDLRSHAGPVIGHNPLGALSVFAVLGVCLFQATSGLFITDEISLEGPLYKHISNALASALGEVHETMGNLLIPLLFLHLAAIFFYRFAKRENLIAPMLTGKKEIPSTHPASDAEGGSAALGLMAFAVAALIVWYVVTQI